MKRMKKVIALCAVVVVLAALGGLALAQDAEKKIETASAEMVEKVNINTASVEELTQLKRIGTKYAERIVEYREKEPFKSPEDIMKVKGIGQKVYDLNKEIIVVD